MGQCDTHCSVQSVAGTHTHCGSCNFLMSLLRDVFYELKCTDFVKLDLRQSSGNLCRASKYMFIGSMITAPVQPLRKGCMA